MATDPRTRFESAAERLRAAQAVITKKLEELGARQPDGRAAYSAEYLAWEIESALGLQHPPYASIADFMDGKQ